MKKVLDELSKCLSTYHVTLINLTMRTKPDLQICLTIADIVKDFHSTPAIEKKVEDLLTELCRLYFKQLG